MELDAFTRDLLRRSQARKEYLNKKLNEMNQQPTRKRHAALTDENQLENDDQNVAEQVDESPKRQCLETPPKTLEILNDKNDCHDEDKENAFQVEEPNAAFVPYVAASTRGLAALRKAKFSSDTGTDDGNLKDGISSASKESQGFVKSSSSSKLQYEFPSESEIHENNNITNGKKVCIANDDKKDEKLNSLKNNLNDASKTTKLADAKSNLAAEVVINEPISPNLTAQNIDPAELPLSARKALFEKTLCGVGQKQTTNVAGTNMSVAQRAALFEQAAKVSSKPSTPRKLREGERHIPSAAAAAVSTKLFSSTGTPPPSPKPAAVQNPQYIKVDITTSVHLSPSKTPIASKTISLSSNMQRAQSSNVGRNILNDLPNDAPSDVQTGSKREISALVSHWEKVSTSNFDNNAELNQLQPKRSKSSSGESNVPVFDEDEMKEEESEEEGNDDGDNENNETQSYNESESEEHSDEEEEIAQELNRDETNVACKEKIPSTEDIERELTKDAVAVCDEMDEILNEALEYEEEPVQSNIPSTSEYIRENLKSGSISSMSSTGSSAYGYSTDDQNSFSSPVTADASNANEEVPLMHTVSFYRKQKKQKKVLSVPIVVRKEKVESPPSPKVDQTEDIKRKIKDLQEEIRAQQTVISQTSQALNLCHATEEFYGSTEQVEFERLLLIATQKRQACLNEIQRLKTHGALGSHYADGTGTLIMNDIRLPLKRDFIASQLEGKGGDTVHHFLCLIRHGAQAIFTQMLSTNEGVKNGSLCFTNHVTLQNLPADFCVAFEVYALQTKKEVISHDKKYHIRREHSKLRLTPKMKRPDSKLPAISSPGGPNAVRTPSFAVVGFTRFTLQNCDRKICTLDKVPFSSPLEGVLQLKMQLHAEHNVVQKGFLTMFEDVSGFGAWHRRWCVLEGSTMAYWKYPDDEKKKEPIVVIDLKKCITNEVRLVSRDICARPHTFQLIIVRPQEKGDKNTLISRSVNTITSTKYLLSADTKEERMLWCSKLNEALTNVRMWDPKALRPIEHK